MCAEDNVFVLHLKRRHIKLKEIFRKFQAHIFCYSTYHKTILLICFYGVDLIQKVFLFLFLSRL